MFSFSLNHVNGFSLLDVISITNHYIFSTLSTVRVKESNELNVIKSLPDILLTISFHSLARPIDHATATIAKQETKAITLHQQTNHILFTKSLAELQYYICRHDGMRNGIQVMCWL